MTQNRSECERGPADPLAEMSEGRLLEQVALPRWTAPAFLLFAVVLVPWIVWLAVSLPSSHTDQIYDVTWVGFDIGLLMALATVVVLAQRRSTLVEIAATIAGTMLVVDAWFDITTSTPGADRWEAVLAAVLAELPIAALCAWLTSNAEVVRRRGRASLIHQLSFRQERGPSRP